jgi:hypothetical protein
MGAANFSCIKIDRAGKVVDVLAVESPRDRYIPRDPIATAWIIVHGYVPNIDVLGPETGNRLISNRSPANVKRLVVGHAPPTTKFPALWRPAVGRPESLVIAIAAVALPIITRAGTTATLESA